MPPADTPPADMSRAGTPPPSDSDLRPGPSAALPIATGRTLLEGEATGPLLRLGAAISFWGGVDPVRGVVCDPRHPDYMQALADHVVWIPSTIGSSSSSSVLLELLRLGTAPAALLLGRRDTILSLGAVVAREMGYPTIPVVELPEGVPARVPDGRMVHVDASGAIRLA